MALLIFKTIHIVGFVAWFAGLFYLVRIFVYHVEADERPEVERKILIDQYQIMQWRVYKIICNPAMMLTWTCGIAMIVINPLYLAMGWMHLKLTMLFLLLRYHLYCKRIIRRMEAGERPLDSFQFRLFNEVPTIFLVSIAFLGVMKTAVNYGYLFLGLGIFAGLMYFGAKRYKRRREESQVSAE